MENNKIIYGGKVLLDSTGDTVTASDLKAGVTAHDKSGAVITGSFDVDAAIQNAVDTAINTAY